MEDENQSQPQSIDGEDFDKQSSRGRSRTEDRGKVTENALEQFRQQWRSELQKATVSTSKANSRDASPAVVSVNSLSSKESTPSSIVEDHGLKKKNEVPPSTELDVVEKARRLFQNGIDFERQGKMHDAIRSYRQALQLVPDIEKRMLVSSGGTAGGARTYANVASEASGGTCGCESVVETAHIVLRFR